MYEFDECENDEGVYYRFRRCGAIYGKVKEVGKRFRYYNTGGFPLDMDDLNAIAEFISTRHFWQSLRECLTASGSVH